MNQSQFADRIYKFGTMTRADSEECARLAIMAMIEALLDPNDGSLEFQNLFQAWIQYDHPRKAWVTLPQYGGPYSVEVPSKPRLRFEFAPYIKDNFKETQYHPDVILPCPEPRRVQREKMAQKKLARKKEAGA